MKPFWRTYHRHRYRRKDLSFSRVASEKASKLLRAEAVWRVSWQTFHHRRRHRRTCSFLEIFPSEVGLLVGLEYESRVLELKDLKKKMNCHQSLEEGLPLEVLRVRLMGSWKGV